MLTTYTTIVEAAASLARQLAEDRHGSVVVEPGDLTRYEVHVVDTGDATVVALPDWGVSGKLGLGHTTVDYAEEKLRDIGPVTAQVVADLLTATGEEHRRITAPDEALGTDGVPLFEVVAALEYDADTDTLT